MRGPHRALPLVLAAILLLSPIASAAPIFSRVLDEHLGDVNRRLQTANDTYGERSEFQRARTSLSRAGIGLLNNASPVAQDNLVKAVGGLETGRARAQAGGDSQRVVDHGRQQASQARSQLSQIRNSLDSLEDTPLKPVGLSGGLTVAYSAHRALDLLDQHRTAVNQWERGDSNDRLEAAIVSTGAGALLSAQVARDTLGRVTQAHANASPTPVVPPEDLAAIADDRVQWSEANAAALAKKSRDRVLAMDESDEELMTLSAFTIYFQDVAFNGIRQKSQRGEDVQPFETGWELHNRSKPRIEAWAELLDIPADLPRGAIGSTNMTLLLNQNKTGEGRVRAGAFAVGMAHLGIETTGILQEAYANESHEPGTDLAPASLSSGSEDDRFVPAPGLLAALAAAACALALGRRRQP